MVDTPAVEEPFSPASGRTNPADKKTWFGHPRELARLFTTEMWERFGYYGMRALLTLYLTKHFLFSDQQATGLYGGYTALVYLTPLVGGFIADQYLGSKRSIKFGAILMAIGYFTLAFGGSPAKPYAEVNGQRYEVVVDNFVDRPTSDPNEARFLVENGQKLQIRGNEDGSVSLLNNGQEAKRLPKGSVQFGGERDQMTLIIMLVALSLVSVGNGFFKPNISTIVGALYDQGDRRRDAGFTIFYMGINLGSIGGQLLCPFLADWFGWWAGLSLAGIGMLISYALIQFDGGRLSGYGERPETAKNRDMTIYICALLAVPVFVLYPILIVIFGLNRWPLIGIGFLFAVVAMAVNTLNGLERVPRVLLRTARVCRLSTLDEIRLITLPASLPFVFTGIKLTVVYAFIAVVAGEFVLSGSGFGYQIAFAYNAFDNPTMYGLMVLMLVFVTTINGLLRQAERRLYRRIRREAA